MTSKATVPERDRLVRKLESIATLSPLEKDALLALPMTVRDLGADQDIVREGDCPSESCLLLDGFACRYKILPDGRRQIMSFHTPGDIPDLLSIHLPLMDHSLGTLVPCKLAFIAHESLRELTRKHPGLATAFWRDTLIDAAIFREWMVGLGRRTAFQRIAHLLCEMAMRLEAVGLADNHAFELPVTQSELGDALGLSTVHMNRVLQELRQGGFITFRGTKVTAPDWNGLKQAGEFDPAYLHIQRDVAL